MVEVIIVYKDAVVTVSLPISHYQRHLLIMVNVYQLMLHMYIIKEQNFMVMALIFQAS